MQPEGIGGFHQSSSAQGAGSSSAYFPRARAHCLAEGCLPESSSPSPVAFLIALISWTSGAHPMLVPTPTPQRWAPSRKSVHLPRGASVAGRILIYRNPRVVCYFNMAFEQAVIGLSVCTGDQSCKSAAGI